MPPALPPRARDQLPPSSAAWQGGQSESREANECVHDAKCRPVQEDPRKSSQESLLPDAANEAQRRTLLLIYIHGFMGSETSFRSFPAHVHNLLTVLIGDSYVVHTKIYPRYRSRGNISIARDNFGTWLEPHEASTTDVILLGHSMGGLLASEVALKPSNPVASSPLQHRILGIINFDVPFLGMHPGVVKSGLASVFKPGEEVSDKWYEQSHQSSNASKDDQNVDTHLNTTSRVDTFWGKTDPNFNPKFANDVTLPLRKGWRNAWHFANKHSDELLKSTKKLFTSHMEFGGVMANYTELKARYARIRALEEENEGVRRSVLGPENVGQPPRVRFVNYYTASTKRKRKSKSRSPGPSRPSSRPSSSHTSLNSANSSSVDVRHPSGGRTLSSVIAHGEPWHEQVTGTPGEHLSHDATFLQTNQSGKLPSLSPDVQDHRNAEQSARAADHVTREAERLRLEEERMQREARRLRGDVIGTGKDTGVVPRILESASPLPISAAPNSTNAQDNAMLTPATAGTDAEARVESPRAEKEHFFCNLPPRDAQGRVDPCWARVFMEDMDEVSAHCGLFFVDERYERLVGDVAERIEQWILADDRAAIWAADRGRPEGGV